LSLEEFETRTAHVFAADTRGEVDRAFADLPPLPGSGTTRRRRGRRHGEGDGVEPHWRPSDERFRDPSTGRITRVWIDPLDGTRHYVPER
jgi:3'-phosphoadenosine 5'-phosphosulfate (PAPS) 3'-phosphatase